MTELEQAIELARSGDKAAARSLLGKIIKQDPGNEVAWGWLAHCVTTKDEKIYCLRRVVEINPANVKAQVALEKLSQSQPTPPAQPAPPVQPTPAQPVVERSAPAQPAQTAHSEGVTAKEKPSTFNHDLALLGGILVVVGSFLPWATIPGYRSISGIEGDGIFTVALGILIALSAFIVHQGAVILLSLCALVFWAVKWSDLASVIQETSIGSIGIGLYFIFLGAVLGIVGGGAGPRSVSPPKEKRRGCRRSDRLLLAFFFATPIWCILMLSDREQHWRTKILVAVVMVLCIALAYVVLSNMPAPNWEGMRGYWRCVNRCNAAL